MDKEHISAITIGLATLALISQIFLALFIVGIFLLRLDKKNKEIKKITQFLSDNSLPFAFLVAVAATAGPLFLSEIAHFTPCKLCWFQRIFMFPQVLILGIATFTNDFGVRKYIIPLSIVGLAIAIYQYALQ